MSEETKLKPCPFCGGEAKISKNKMNSAFVYCTKCDTRAYGPFEPYEQSLKGAVEIWNRREMTEQMVTNEKGGKQHRVEERCEALFPRAILSVAKLRKTGYEVHGYEDENYRNISAREHIGRAMRHLLLWQTGDEEDGCDTDHLVHACCRTMMALELILDSEEELIREADRKAYREAFLYDDDRR